jgi:GTP-binding protein HflX
VGLATIAFKDTSSQYLAEKDSQKKMIIIEGFSKSMTATLQEAVDADLLLHVVDASNLDYPLQIEQVQRVLSEIGAQDVPQLLVFNKMDAMPTLNWPQRMNDSFEIDGVQTPRIFVSAKDSTGIAELRRMLAQLASQTPADAARVPDQPEFFEADS